MLNLNCNKFGSFNRSLMMHNSQKNTYGQISLFNIAEKLFLGDLFPKTVLHFLHCILYNKLI